MSTWFTKAAVAAGVLLTTTTARADGLAARTADVAEPARADLAAAIASDRAARPDAYDVLGRVHGMRRDVYGQRRKMAPNVGPELERLGPTALLPMLDALAFHAPALEGGGTSLERSALVVGLLDAVGAIGDARSLPVLRATLEGALAASDATVARAAAQALGKLGSDAAFAALSAHTKDGDPLRAASIAGLGECRRLDSAQRLAALLGAAGDEDARVVAAALAQVGSRFVWQAMGPAAAPQGLAVRAVAARALVAAYAARPATRARVGAAILAVAHPDTPAIVADARRGADATTAAALDDLGRDVARALAR
jgi:hypothetical protein